MKSGSQTRNILFALALLAFLAAAAMRRHGHNSADLVEAIKLQQFALADEIISRGVDVNQPNDIGVTPLYEAADYARQMGPQQAEHARILMKLLDLDLNVDPRSGAGKLAWSIAAQFGHSRMLERQLAANVDVNQRTDQMFGGTAIATAVAAGKIEVVDLLLSHGADVNGTNANGGSALVEAAASAAPGHSQVAIISLLLSHGARVNEASAGGRSALHWAATREDVESCRLLVRHGADTNAETREGSTPLHLAASAGNVEIVALLVRNGARPEVRDSYGHTALDQAIVFGKSVPARAGDFTKIVALLRARKAQ